MRSVSVAKAKEQLTKLLVAAQSGERIVVTNRGRPVAEIVAPRPAGAVDSTAGMLDWLKAERVGSLDPAIDSAALIRSMRDGAER